MHYRKVGSGVFELSSIADEGTCLAVRLRCVMSLNLSGKLPREEERSMAN